jgi:hypothetical protein
VTEAAILTALPPVYIVETVAVVALLWRVFVALRRVAGRATGLHMLATQGKVRAVVVKGLFAPARLVVAIAAGFPQCTAMDIVLLVAVDTLSRRFSPGFASFVAIAAGRNAVGAGQRKVGESMVEAVSIERCYVGIPPQVITVALAATCIRLVPATMKTQLTADVVGDLSVAIQAQLILRLLGKGLVTGSTIIFFLGMCRDQFAGHQ